MNKIFQLLLVAYVAFYLLDNRHDKLKDSTVCGNVNTISTNNSTAETAGFGSAGVKFERDVMNENATLPQFAGKTGAILNSTTAITRYYRKNEVAATPNLALPKHLLVN